MQSSRSPKDRMAARARIRRMLGTWTLGLFLSFASLEVQGAPPAAGGAASKLVDEIETRVVVQLRDPGAGKGKALTAPLDAKQWRGRLGFRNK